MSSFAATDAAAYETFMGRWSERLAGPFLAASGIGAAGRVLDVGCGTGVLAAAVAHAGAQEVVGIDASAPYLDHARRHRARPNVRYELGDARRLAFEDASFDAALSSLVLDVLPEAGQVAAEMRRVTRPGGVVASVAYDFWGGLGAFATVWDTAAVLDSGVRAIRDELKSHPLARAGGQAALWREVGLVDVGETPIVIAFDYASFEDYWSTFMSGQGRIGARIKAMDETLRAEISDHVRAAYLGGMGDGPRSFVAVARAVRGVSRG
jgi:SAM-dependent methyltransferase